MKVAFNKYYSSVSDDEMFLVTIKLILIEVAYEIQIF